MEIQAGELVRAAASGDEAAFTELVARHHRDLLRVAYVICRDSALAEDSAQAAWAIAWRRLRDVKDPAHVNSWLVAVVANEARRTMRSRRRKVHEISIADIELEGVPDLRSDPLADGIANADLRRVVATLDPTDRALIALRYVAEPAPMRSDMPSGCPRRAPEDVSRACSFGFVENFTMDDFDLFERQLASALRSDADQSLAHYEPATVARAAMAGTQRGTLRLPGTPSGHVQPLGARRGCRHRRPGDRRRVLHDPARPAVDRRPEPNAERGAPASPPRSSRARTPAPTPTSTAEATPPAVGQNLKLTWTKLSLAQRSPRIAWLVDRFVQVDDESRVVQTSTDGFSWHVLQPGDPDPGYLDLMTEVRNAGLVTWGDDIVRWWNPEQGADIGGKPPITARDIVRIVRPRCRADGHDALQGPDRVARHRA